MELKQTLQQMNLSVSQDDIRLDFHIKYKYYYRKFILTIWNKKYFENIFGISFLKLFFLGGKKQNIPMEQQG